MKGLSSTFPLDCYQGSYQGSNNKDDTGQHAYECNSTASNQDDPQDDPFDK